MIGCRCKNSNILSRAVLMARVAWSVQRTTSSTSHTLYSNFNWLHDKTQLSKPFSIWSAAIPRGSHPFPSRTRSLSLAGRMVLHERSCGRVRRRRPLHPKARLQHLSVDGLLCIQAADTTFISPRTLRRNLALTQTTTAARLRPAIDNRPQVSRR